MSPGDESKISIGPLETDDNVAFFNQFEGSDWEVRYAGVTYRPYAHDTVPNVMQRFLAKWLLGVIWIKVEPC
jgi:hypothetical protein